MLGGHPPHVISPTWDLSPSCKQALRVALRGNQRSCFDKNIEVSCVWITTKTFKHNSFTMLCFSLVKILNSCVNPLQHLDVCLPTSKALRSFTFLNSRPLPLPPQNEIQLFSRFYCYQSWFVYWFLVVESVGHDKLEKSKMVKDGAS